MASSSPYQQNDYRAISTFRPYQLPVNDILKAYVAQNQFWDQGAARVKSVYENALGLDLTIAENKRIRDEFMKEAEKQLTKLSSMDLSDPSVQRQGFGIFKPLLTDEGVMSDDESTKHIRKVHADALSFRNKEGGKYYSSTNHQYALWGADEFQNATDRMAGKKYLQQRKEYEPFYDPTSELSTLMKNCKPDKATGDQISGMYIRTYTDESLSASKINSCIDAQLSDRARRQLEINGAMTYKRNPEALRDKYLPHLQGTRSSLSIQRAAIDAVLTNKGNLKNLKKEDLAKLGISDISQLTPDYIQSLEEQGMNIDSRLTNLDNTVNQLMGGDFTPILGDNYERVASTVYSRDWMQNVGEGLSYNFQSNTIKADPVQMLIFRENQTNNRQEDEQNFDLFFMERKAELDLASKLAVEQAKGGAKGATLKDVLAGNAGGSIIDQARVQNDTTSPFSSIDKTDSYDQVTQKRVEIADQRRQLQQSWITDARDFGLPDYITATTQPEWQEWWNKFALSAKGDPVKEAFINKYYTKQANLIALEDMYRNTQANVDAQLAPLEQKNMAKIAQLPSAIVDGHLIKPTDVYNALLGKQSPLRIEEKQVTTYSASGTTNIPTSTGSVGFDLYINGKKVDDPKLHELVRRVRVTDNNNAKEIKNQRQILMQKETVLQREGYNFAALDYEGGPIDNLRRKIASDLGIPSDFYKDVVIEQTDLDGNVVITLNKRETSDKTYNYDEAFKRLQDYNARENKKVEGRDNTVMVQGLSDFDFIDHNDLGSIMTPYIRSLEGRARMNQPASTGYIRAENGRSYRLTVTPSIDNGFSYKIIDESNPNNPVFMSDDRQETLNHFQLWIVKSRNLKVPTK